MSYKTWRMSMFIQDGGQYDRDLYKSHGEIVV